MKIIKAIDARDIKDAIAEYSNILDSNTREHYRYHTWRRGIECSTGGFCVAFPMDKKSNKEEKYELCFRIWHQISNDIQERTAIISDALQKLKLPYFIDFTYIPQALKIGEDIVPGVKMEWIQGKTLDRYIKENATPVKIANLAKEFKEMCYRLKDANIAHGDLSNNNILVTNDGKIRLVDYDSVYVPGMGRRFYQITSGQEAFQHPERKKKREVPASANDDNFSQLVIYLSLLAISKNIELKESVGDNELLFMSNDYANEKAFLSSRGYKEISEIYANSKAYISSKGYKEISGITSEIEKTANTLRRAIIEPYEKTPSLADIFPRAEFKETPKPVFKESPKPIFKETPKTTHIPNRFCTVCGTQFPNKTDNYCTVCGTKRGEIKIA